MQKESTWNYFLIAIGFLLIAIAPTTDYLLSQVVGGLAFVGLGFCLIKKKKK